MSQESNLQAGVRPISEILTLRIIDMTGAEFAALNHHIAQTNVPELVYGIDGLAGVLGVSAATANRIKKSGVIDEAITQVDRTIIVDTRKALSLLHEEQYKKKSSRKLKD